MAKVGTAEYEVEISKAQVRREVDAAGKEIERGLSSSADKASKEIADKLSSIKAAAGAGVAIGAAAALGSATKAASDLNEATQANAVTFRDSAKAVDEFATSASKIGLSKQEALDATSTFGALFVQLGVGTDEAANLSTTMTKLAADFGSFKNADVTEVIQAQSAAFRGEYDALQRFVPTINAAAVEQQALAETGKSTTKELTLQEKALATYTLMMEGAGPAIGDFARNSGQAANSTKIMQAELDNTSASMGQALLPAYTAAVQVVGDLAEVFGKLPGPIQTGIVGFGGLTLAVGLLAPKLKEGVAVFRAAGSGAANFGKNLVVPTSALDGLGGAAEKTGPKIGKFGAALGALAIAGVTYELVQMGREMTKTKLIVDNLLEGTDEDIAGLANAIKAASGAGLDVSFGDVDDLKTLYAMRDAVEATGGKAIPELAAAIKDAEAAQARGAAASAKYGAEVSAVEDAATGAAGAQGEMATETKSAADAFDEAAKAAFELFDAQRQAASASDGVNDAIKAVADANDAVADAERDVADARRGVADAYKGVRDAQKGVQDAYKGVADAQKGLRDAIEGVADAERDLADARSEVADAARELATAQAEMIFGSKDLERAQRGVVDAEKAVAQAQRESKDAQEDLTRARKDAVESLDDLSRSAEGAALAEASARLSLREAQQRRAELGKDGKELSATDVERAELSVKQAELSLRDAIDRNEDIAAQLAESREKGIEGSDEVVAAQDRITQAADGETAAMEGLTEAQQAVVLAREEMAKRVDEATIKLEDANLRVVEAERGVRDAHDAVTEASGRVTEAHDAVREAGDRVREAYDGVGEAQRRVVEATEGVVEARGKVAEAEDGVTDAILAKIEADAAADLASQGLETATRNQIDRYQELADRLSPGDPLRQHLLGLIGDLREAAGDYDINLNFTTYYTDVGAAPPGFNNAERAERRHVGGDVRGGTPYIVGGGGGREEVFVPDRDGEIIPSVAEWRARQSSADSRSGSGTAINIDARGIQDPVAVAGFVGAHLAFAASLEVH